MKSRDKTRGRPKTNRTKTFMFMCLFLAALFHHIFPPIFAVFFVPFSPPPPYFSFGSPLLSTLLPTVPPFLFPLLAPPLPPSLTPSSFSLLSPFFHSYQIWQAPKHTRKRNTPENAANPPFPESAISGVLRFRVCFGALLEGNKEHPKTQHTRRRRFSERSIFCVFGCVAFSGAFPCPSFPFFFWEFLAFFSLARNSLFF